jgi:hypothetical protein
MPTKPSLSAYFRFVGRIRAVQASPGAPQIDVATHRLLDSLVAAWSEDSAFTVTEAMALSRTGSPATVHRHLNLLRTEGLIALHEVISDSRMRTLMPTKKALGYFHRLAACLDDPRGRSRSGDA